MIKKGGNYGWPYFEGIDTLKTDAPEVPLGREFNSPNLQTCTLNAADTSRALVGGYVYRAGKNACLRVSACYCDAR